MIVGEIPCVTQIVLHFTKKSQKDIQFTRDDCRGGR